MDQTILKVEKLTKRFPGVVALRDVSFDLCKGEIHAICGENGAGKSTLIKVLSGAWRHGSYEGRFKIEGQESVFSGIQDAEKAGITVIYQELALVLDMTVAENIFLGNEPTRFGKVDWNRVYADTEELLAQYNLDLDPTAPVGDLGVGQQQLVEIVKALSKNSRLLLLDEPTAALTETEVDILMGIVEELRHNGITCIYISHKLNEVFRIADRITVLRDGESVTTLNTQETDHDEIVHHMVGREIKALFPKAEAETACHETILEVRDLTVTWAGSKKPVLKNINLDIRRGKVMGIGGLMGSGRTELLMHLFCAFGTRVSGRIVLNGQPFTARSPADAIKQGLMLVSEDRKRFGLHMYESIGFNLSLAALPGFVRHGFVDAQAEWNENQAIFDSLGVKAQNLHECVHNLSGGNQQKVVLGKALMTKPGVIFLDEPTRGIDVGAKVDVYNLINQLKTEGKAVVLVSSELPELIGISDRITILSEGQIGGEFADNNNVTQEMLLHAAMAFHETTGNKE